jgi:alpha-D-ribose 1-methylphosphonate 5-triphosphate synthase subunit PhnG
MNRMNENRDRTGWMAVLARATHSEIAAAVEKIDMPAIDIVKPAEVGTIMLEGRAGGSGQRFNAGEATMTRCVVRVGECLGFSYALGRDKKKAVLCAALDGLLQNPMRRNEIFEHVIAPIAAAYAKRQEEASRRAAATKVDFFTMVRGDG